MTNEQNNEVKEAEVLTPAEMTDAIRVLMADNKNANVIREDLKNSQHQNEKDIKLILDDLGNPRSRYERTPTRKLTVAAYEQSRGFISTDDLEGHKIIKDLKEEIQTIGRHTRGTISMLKTRLEMIPSPDNMQDLLDQNLTFKGIEKNVQELFESRHLAHKDRESLQLQINEFKETYNGADHPTGPEFDEEILNTEESKIRHNDLIHFLKGVFSDLQFNAVAKHIEDYKIKSRMESKDNEEPTGTDE